MCILKNPTGWQLFFEVPDFVQEATAPARPPEASNVSCTLHQLTSDPNIFMVPLGGCGRGQYVRRRLLLSQCHSKLCVALFAAICSRMWIKVFKTMDHTSPTSYFPFLGSSSSFGRANCKFCSPRRLCVWGLCQVCQSTYHVSFCSWFTLAIISRSQSSKNDRLRRRIKLRVHECRIAKIWVSLTQFVSWCNRRQVDGRL